MKKTFYKNLFRDIKKTFSRFISIVIIIAVGVAFYSGVRATRPDMELSGDSYFSKSEFMDFKIVSTLGLTSDDISEIKKQPNILKAEGAFSIDGVFEKDERLLVLNINSFPSENGINSIRIIKGRGPKSSTEAVAEERFLKENNLKIGDEIEIKSGKETKIEDSLNNSKFKIVGSAHSPLYVSAQRQLSSVGNGSVRGFVYILPDVFKSDVYTEAYVKTDRNESENSLLNNEDYKKSIEGIEKELKSLGVVRSKVRHNEVLRDAQKKIDEAEDKLKKSKKEAEDKFSEGYKKLEEAEKQLARGEKEIENNQVLFEKEISDGEKQLSYGKEKILEGRKELESGKRQAAEKISSTAKEKVEEAKKKMDSEPENSMNATVYNSLNQVYMRDIKGKDFEDMYKSLKANEVLPQIKMYLDVEKLKKDFDHAEKEIELNEKKLEELEVQLNRAREEGHKKLEDGRKKLADGRIELQKNTEKLKTEEQKANSKLKDGEKEIERSKDKLKELKEPSWYILGRSTNVGYETYRQDSERIGKIGSTFPLIFFLVAALVSLTTMTRMVQENRMEIGTFKALGYSRIAIVSHYLIYSLLASVIGSLIGISFGFRLFPPLIMNAYKALYTIPETVTPFSSRLALVASMLAILFTTVAAVAAALEELREVPASLMRPKPPKSGSSIFLEKITFIWRRLSFTEKVTARNILRYKKRFFMTVIGIAACTGLMITGFGLREGILGATEKQFNKIYKYNMQTNLDKNVGVEKKNEIKGKVEKDDNVSSVLFFYSKNGTIKAENSVSQDAFIVVPESGQEFNRYIDLASDGKSLNLGDDGVIITEKLSKLINKKPGDTAEITLNDKVIKVKVSEVTEHYLQHYIYISPEYYEKLTGKNLEFNGFYGLLKNTSDKSEDRTSKTLADIENIASISYKSNTHFDYDKSMQSVNSVVLIMIISAGVLAFVVIYNLTNININERRRELATIKLLGFYNNELAMYIYRENILLTFLGSLTGIGLGIILNKFVLNAAETNIILFQKTVSPIYFACSVVLTVVFSVVVNLVMYREFDKVDMIQSLKSAE